MTPGQLFTRSFLSEKKQMRLKKRNRNANLNNRKVTNLKSALTVTWVNFQCFFSVWTCFLLLFCLLLSFSPIQCFFFPIASTHTCLKFNGQSRSYYILSNEFAFVYLTVWPSLLSLQCLDTAWLTWSSCPLNPNSSLFYSLTLSLPKHLNILIFFFLICVVPKTLYTLKQIANFQTHIDSGHVSNTLCVFK